MEEDILTMEKNEHAHMVVMSKEVYDHLRYLAGIGAGEVSNHLNDCDKHIRKFNLVLKEKADYERRADILRRRAKRHAAYELMKRKGGKTVYYVDSKASKHYIRGKLIGIVRDDGSLLLRVKLDGKVEESRINPNNVIEELPEGARLGIRRQYGVWVEINTNEPAPEMFGTMSP